MPTADASEPGSPGGRGIESNSWSFRGKLGRRRLSLATQLSLAIEDSTAPEIAPKADVTECVVRCPFNHFEDPETRMECMQTCMAGGRRQLASYVDIRSRRDGWCVDACREWLNCAYDFMR